MQSIIVITNSSKMLENIQNQCNRNNISNFINEHQLNIELESGRLYISLDNGIVDDYEEDELKIINHIFSNSRYFYLLCFSSKIALKNLMSKISFEEKVYVDDDMGNIFPLAEFKKSLI